MVLLTYQLYMRNHTVGEYRDFYFRKVISLIYLWNNQVVKFNWNLTLGN